MATRSAGKYRAWIRPFRHWWKPLKWIWGALILGFVVNDGASWLITKSFDVSGTPLGWVIGHPEITFPLVGALILLTCLAGLAYRQEDVLTIQAEQRLTLSPQRRLQLIRSFRQEYADRLTHSLQGSLALELELHNRTDVIISSASLVFRHQEADEASPLPPGTSILQAYDRIQRGLLILGAPGSGKTTLLLSLARDLLHRAENDPDQPLAIILNLSSWARTRLPLAQWLVQQCSLVYGIPKRHMAAWIEQEQMQFLLDGLDEMGTSARTACIETINSYRQGHLAPLVVCSRSEEYVSQPTRLLLPGSVEIQPLEPAQILQALKQAGTSLAVVRAALRSNAILSDLLTTPLMLSIVILTYRDKTAKELPQSGSPKEQQREIFEQYVQRMLQRYQQQRSFSLTQTTSSLVWLAQQMQQRHLTEFHLESLQADWLSTTRAETYQGVFVLGVWLVFGLIFGLGGGLVFGLGTWLLSGLFGGLVFVLLSGLFGGLLSVGLVFGLIFGLDGGQINIKPVEKFVWSWEGSGKEPGGLVGGLVGGLFLGLYFGLVYGLFVGLLVGLLVGLFLGLFLGLSGTPTTAALPNHSYLK